eukprot:SAG31_NODE_14007_length_832_cov_1.518417_1_plen_44_part_10
MVMHAKLGELQVIMAIAILQNVLKFKSKFCAQSLCSRFKFEHTQ